MRFPRARSAGCRPAHGRQKRAVQWRTWPPAGKRCVRASWEMPPCGVAPPVSWRVRTVHVKCTAMFSQRLRGIHPGARQVDTCDPLKWPHRSLPACTHERSPPRRPGRLWFRRQGVPCAADPGHARPGPAHRRLARCRQGACGLARCAGRGRSRRGLCRSCRRRGGDRLAERLARAAGDGRARAGQACRGRQTVHGDADRSARCRRRGTQGGPPGQRVPEPALGRGFPHRAAPGR